MRSVPTSVPSIVPRPPFGEQPPMMTAAMTSSSSERPAEGCALEAREVAIIAARPVSAPRSA